MLRINGQVVPTTAFPDNTSQVWKLDANALAAGRAHVYWEFAHEGEFMQLAQLKALLDSVGITTTLRLSYLPYGRQDKDIQNDRTFALRPFAALLNSLAFEMVTIEDPHSSVALDLIANAVAVYPTEKVLAVFRAHADLACFPDAGAMAKYRDVYPALPFTYGEKLRDQTTGRIVSYDLKGDVRGRNVLVIDDICDGGTTFRLLASELKVRGAESVILFVTHGIFSAGTRILFDSGIDKIFTKNGEVGPRSQQSPI